MDLATKYFVEALKETSQIPKSATTNYHFQQPSRKLGLGTSTAGSGLGHPRDDLGRVLLWLGKP